MLILDLLSFDGQSGLDVGWVKVHSRLGFGPVKEFYVPSNLLASMRLNICLGLIFFFFNFFQI